MAGSSQQYMHCGAPSAPEAGQRVTPAHAHGGQVPQVPSHEVPPTPNPFDMFEVNISHRTASSVHTILEAQTKLLLQHSEATAQRERAEATMEINAHIDSVVTNLAEAMRNAHKIQVNNFNRMIKALAPLVHRVTELEHSVQELLERQRDPEAALSGSDADARSKKDIVTHEMGVSPIKAPFRHDDGLTDIPLVSPMPSMRRKGANIKEHNPFIEPSLSPAIWALSKDQPLLHESSIFRPNLSAEGRKAYSVFKDPAPDGTVSSLRRVSLGGDGLLDSSILNAAELSSTPSASTDNVPMLSLSPTPEQQQNSPTSPAPSPLPAPQRTSTPKLPHFEFPCIPSAEQLFDAPTPSMSFIDEQHVSDMTLERFSSPLTPVHSPGPSPSFSPDPSLPTNPVQVKKEKMEKEATLSRLRKIPQSKAMASTSASASKLPMSKRPSSSVPSKRVKKVKVKHAIIFWREPTVNRLTDLVACDRCEQWYHVGCLGCQEDDPRLAPGAEFICPVCLDPDHHSRALVKEDVCGRPGCKMSHTFVIECILGRKHIVANGARRYDWLVKWCGYTTAEASWEQQAESFQKHISEFEVRAREEGKDPEENPYDDILLKQALDAGHRYY